MISGNPKAFTGAFLYDDWDHACGAELYVVASGISLAFPSFVRWAMQSRRATALSAWPQLAHALMSMAYEYTSGRTSRIDDDDDGDDDDDDDDPPPPPIPSLDLS